MVASSYGLGTHYVFSKPRKTLADRMANCPKCGALSDVEGPYDSTIPGQQPVSKRTIRCPNAKGKQPSCSVTVEVVGPAEREVVMPVLSEQEAETIKEGLAALGWSQAKLAEETETSKTGWSNIIQRKGPVSDAKKQEAMGVIARALKRNSVAHQPAVESTSPEVSVASVDPLEESTWPGKPGCPIQQARLDETTAEHFEQRCDALATRLCVAEYETNNLAKSVEQLDRFGVCSQDRLNVHESKIASLRDRLDQALHSVNQLAAERTESIVCSPYAQAEIVEAQARKLMLMDTSGHLLKMAFYRATTTAPQNGGGAK